MAGAMEFSAPSWRAFGVAYPPARQESARAILEGVGLFVAVAIAVGVTAIGLQKSLPYTPEIDEPAFVDPAVHIAATGDLNPHWFGHPGATVIYPLALVIRLAQAASVFSPGDLQAQYAASFQNFYLIGRLESITYEILAIPLVYFLGRATFGRSAALIGAMLTALMPIAVAHAQVVRTDSAAVFFGMLSLLLCVRVHRRTTYSWIVAAGISIGLAIATRWFMVALVPVLLAALATGARAHGSNVGWRMFAVALAAVAAGFAIASPFALVDLKELRSSLGSEAERTHLGADGLSPPGNFMWYVVQSLPSDLTWPVALGSVTGIVLVLRRRHPVQLLLIGYVALHLLLISVAALHWHRWAIQVLPVLALCFGYAVQVGVQRFRIPGTLSVLLVGLASVQAICQLIVWDVQQVQESPRVLAREWITDSLAPGTGVAEEWYGPPLDGTPFRVELRLSLSEGSLAQWVKQNYPVVVVSSAVYERYFAEPQRYSREVAFYDRLFAQSQLLHDFRSVAPGLDQLTWLGGGAECNCSLSPTRGPIVIRIYRLADTANEE
jgi:hypothetical protein